MDYFVEVLLATEILLNQGLDPTSLRRQFEIKGRIRIANAFKTSHAEAIYNCLANEIPWTLAYMDGKNPVSITQQEFGCLSAEQKIASQHRIHEQAANHFGFLYNHYSLSYAYEEGLNRHLYVNKVFEYLSSEHFMDFVKRATNVQDIVKIDAQAARYASGHFLNVHNDSETPTRRIAYVLNFTKNWKADWGGMLHFLDRQGNVIESYTPVFNTLVLFAVSVLHCVSYIVPYAKNARYTITGWLMAKH